MKKLTLGMFILLMSTVSLGQLMSITPILGLTASEYYVDKLLDSKFKLGYAVGVSSNYRLSQTLDLKTELLFMQKGTRYIGAGILEFKDSYTFNYLNMPVLLKYNLGKKNNAFVNGGIYAGYLLDVSSRWVGSIHGKDYDEKTNWDIKEWNRFDFGIGIGGGMVFPINDKNEILLDLRYDLSINSTNKKENSEHLPKQHTLSLSMGYVFGLQN